MQDLLEAPSLWLTSDPGPMPCPVPEPCWSCWDEQADAAEAPADQAGWAIPGVPRPEPAPAPLVTDLQAAVAALVVHGPLSGSRRDTLALLQLAEQVRGLALRELAEMDAVGGHLRPGVQSTTATWLRDNQQRTDGAARADVTLGTALRDDLPRLGALLLTGTITVEHARAVVDGVRGLDPQMVREAEDGLCGLAQLKDPSSLRSLLRDKAAAISDRIAAEAGRRARERMGLRLNDVGSHTAVDGTLAGDDGATVRLAMDLAVEAAREAGDTRGKSARQADVLVRWARDYLDRHHGAGDSLADDAHTVRTHLHVTCTSAQLAALGAIPAEQQAERQAAPTLRDLLLDPDAVAAPGIVGDLGPLSRGALRRLACDATLDLIVLPTPQRDRNGRRLHGVEDPLHVGRSARTVTGAQFRALLARDRHCIVKGCRRRPAQCAAHHVRHWADGGLTDLDNLVLLCHQHHHDHHDRGLDLPHRDGLRWLTQDGWAHAPPSTTRRGSASG